MHVLNTWQVKLEVDLHDNRSGTGRLALNCRPSIVGNKIVTTHIRLKFGGDKETLYQCFSTAGPRPGTGPWHQLYRAARGLRKLQNATRFR